MAIKDCWSCNGKAEYTKVVEQHEGGAEYEIIRCSICGEMIGGKDVIKRWNTRTYEDILIKQIEIMTKALEDIPKIIKNIPDFQIRNNGWVKYYLSVIWGVADKAIEYAQYVKEE